MLCDTAGLGIYDLSFEIWRRGAVAISSIEITGSFPPMPNAD